MKTTPTLRSMRRLKRLQELVRLKRLIEIYGELKKKSAPPSQSQK